MGKDQCRKWINKTLAAQKVKGRTTKQAKKDLLKLKAVRSKTPAHKTTAYRHMNAFKEWLLDHASWTDSRGVFAQFNSDYEGIPDEDYPPQTHRAFNLFNQIKDLPKKNNKSIFKKEVAKARAKLMTDGMKPNQKILHFIRENLGLPAVEILSGMKTHAMVKEAGPVAENKAQPKKKKKVQKKEDEKEGEKAEKGKEKEAAPPPVLKPFVSDNPWAMLDDC